MSVRRKAQLQKTDSVVDRVRAIYRALEKIPVERACELKTECCRFKLTGLTPYVTQGEAFLAAKALRAAGRTKLPEAPDGACPMLDRLTGKCVIYSDRPFGCRTHFCEAAGGPMPRKSVVHLIRELEVIDAELGGDGGRMLPGAVAAALKQL